MHHQCNTMKDISAFCTLGCITLYFFEWENSRSFNISGIAFFFFDSALVAIIKVQSVQYAISSLVLDISSGSHRTCGRSEMKITEQKEKAYSECWHALVLARLGPFSVAHAFKHRKFTLTFNWTDLFSAFCLTNRLFIRE